MASILIVGRDHVTSEWVLALQCAGHSVELCDDALAFQDRFHGAPADVLIVEITKADHGEAMLMVQARSVWPECRVVAVPQDRSYRCSAVQRMGLWTPDLTLMQPLAGTQLAASVRQILAGAGSDCRAPARHIVGWSQTADLLPCVTLRCGAPARVRWSVRTN